jgi:hypothetical protein
VGEEGDCLGLAVVLDTDLITGEVLADHSRRHLSRRIRIGSGVLGCSGELPADLWLAELAVRRRVRVVTEHDEDHDRNDDDHDAADEDRPGLPWRLRLTLRCSGHGIPLGGRAMMVVRRRY